MTLCWKSKDWLRIRVRVRRLLTLDIHPEIGPSSWDHSSGKMTFSISWTSGGMYHAPWCSASLTIMSCITVISPSFIVTGTDSSWWKSWRQRVAQTLSLVPWVRSWFFWLPGREQGYLEGLCCFCILPEKTSYTILPKSSGYLVKFCLRISQFIHVAWKVQCICSFRD